MATKLRRTTDRREILQILGHPEITPQVFEGDVPELPFGDQIYYLLAIEERFGDGAVEDRPIGLLLFMPVNSIAWNPHIAILPEHRGSGTEVMRLGLEWMFENTRCRKVVAHPPVFKPEMIRVFEKCGFALEGKSPKSFGWRGELHDRLLMGLEKGA